MRLQQVGHALAPGLQGGALVVEELRVRHETPSAEAALQSSGSYYEQAPVQTSLKWLAATISRLVDVCEARSTWRLPSIEERRWVVFCRSLCVRIALVFQTHVDGGEEFDQCKTEGRRTRQL